MDKEIKRYLAQIGAKGGKAAVAKMTPEQMSERGRKMVAARKQKPRGRTPSCLCGDCEKCRQRLAKQKSRARAKAAAKKLNSNKNA